MKEVAHLLKFQFTQSPELEIPQQQVISSHGSGGDQQDRQMLLARAPPHAAGRAPKPFKTPCSVQHLTGSYLACPEAAAFQCTGISQPQKQPLLPLASRAAWQAGLQREWQGW